jgi:hypothetical protein
MAVTQKPLSRRAMLKGAGGGRFRDYLTIVSNTDVANAEP